jgi:hypothetical protein
MLPIGLYSAHTKRFADAHNEHSIAVVQARIKPQNPRETTGFTRFFFATVTTYKTGIPLG